MDVSRRSSWKNIRDGHWAGYFYLMIGILMISTLRQRRKELRLELRVETMVVLLQAISCFRDADSQKSPFRGHSIIVKEFETTTQHWVKDSQSQEALRQKRVYLAKRLRSDY